MVLPLVEDVLRSLVLREAAVFASSAAQSSGLPTWQHVGDGIQTAESLRPQCGRPGRIWSLTSASDCFVGVRGDSRRRRWSSKLVPPEDWRPYLKVALETPRVLAERKTGSSTRK